MDTKACSLTEDEVKILIMEVGRNMDETNIDNTLERMNYLNRRLKAFNEPEKPEAVIETQNVNASSTNEAAPKGGW